MFHMVVCIGLPMRLALAGRSCRSLFIDRRFNRAIWLASDSLEYLVGKASTLGS